MPIGRWFASRSPTSSGSWSPRISTSAMSASVSIPTARGSASEMTGRGFMPLLRAMSNPARRSAPSSVSTVSRCDRKRALPPTAKVIRYVNDVSQFSCAVRTGSDPVRSLHQLVADGAETRAAVGAAVPAAVACGHLGLALPPLVQQELLGDARAHVIPRQLVPLSVLTGRDLVDRRPRRRERRLPGGLRVHLCPRVEA